MGLDNDRRLKLLHVFCTSVADWKFNVTNLVKNRREQTLEMLCWLSVLGSYKQWYVDFFVVSIVATALMTALLNRRKVP